MHKVMYVVIAAWVSIAPAAQGVNLETVSKQEMALRKVGTETLT